MSENALAIQSRLPPELNGWVVTKSEEETGWTWEKGRGVVVWLERLMPDGTTLKFEALLHDVERELPMLVPILVAVTNASAPNMRLSVTRTKATRFEVDRARERRRLTGR